MSIDLQALKARIKPARANFPTYKILIYGDSGVGKTSLFKDAKDTLILDVEEGTSVFKGESSTDVAQITCWEDLQGYYALLQSGELRYTNVVLDSITEYQELCKDYVLKTYQRNRISPDVPSQQDYGEISEKMRKMLRQFRALDCNVIYIARTKYTKDDTTGEIRVRPDVVGKLENDLPGAMDIVGYMAANADGERFICFNLTGKYLAKDRTHSFPDVLKNPTWADFEKALPGLVPREQAEAVS